MKTNVLLLVCLTVMVSCMDHKDLYNPETNTETTDNPLDIEVPNDMDYSLITTVSVRVDVDDEYLGKYYYVVEVYNNNPLASETSDLKAAGVAKQGEPFVANVELGAAQKYLFVKRTDPRGRSVIGCLEVTEGASSLSYDFNSSTSAKSVSRTVQAREVSWPTYNKVPDDAIEVKGCSTNDDWFVGGKTYCITGTYTDGIYHSGRGECKLFVSGTWKVPASKNGHWNGSNIETGLEVIILPGGRIETDGNLTFIGTSGLTVMKDATLQCANLTLTNTGTVYNLGQMNLKKANIQSTPSFYNACAIKVEETLFADAGNFTIYLFNGVVEAKNITFNNVTISMSDASMVKAIEKINNMSHTKYYATGSTKSLVDAADINCVSDVLYDGQLVVHFSNSHSSGDAYWSPYEMANGAFLTKDNVLSIETCGGGSVIPDPGHDPSDPTFPLEVKTTDTYIYAMEDQWPSFGDYDMNDVVVLVKKKLTTSSNYVKELTFDCELKAIGASNKIAAAIQLDGITQDMLRTGGDYMVKNEKYENTDYHVGYFTLMDNSSNHSEQGQTYVTLPLFGYAQELLGGDYVNVGRGTDKTDCPDLSVKIRFKENAVKSNDLEYTKINFFIMTNGVERGRTEIHLPGFKATDLVGSTSGGVDNGKGIYVSEDNLSWGFLIPTENWTWPNENVNIKNVYPDIVAWMTSGGKTNKDWYSK